MNIRVIHGANEGIFDLEGTRIGDLRRSLRDVFNIPSDAGAFIGGKQVMDDRVIKDGESAEFIREQGFKGLGALLTPAELRDRWQIDEHDYRQLLDLGLPRIQLRSDVRHPEIEVDEFFRQRAVPDIKGDLQRIANHFDPSPPGIVGSSYISERLGCSTYWVTLMVRRGAIPSSCVVPGTGNGKPWKFNRSQVDKWIKNR